MAIGTSISSIMQQEKKVFSIEFFPPKTEASGQKMLDAAKEISSYNPDFATITYGAGGSTRSRTLEYAKKLKEDFGFEMMPHLTCVGHSKDDLRGILKEFHELGVRNIMTLRGDPPQGETNFKPHPDGLSYASELVTLIKNEYPEFCLGVAGYPEKHPEAVSLDEDIKNLAHKVEQGASFVTTQLFFDNQLYFEFVDKCRNAGITIPILPGLLPVLSLEQIQRFCTMCGASLPEELKNRLQQADDEEAVGIEWAVEQTRDLFAKGAPGLHLYVMNKSHAACQIANKLKSEGLIT